MAKSVTNYYNKIATEYDQSRFSNTYGQYIDQQERRLMHHLTAGIPKDKILDLGCGTGRFLELANHGIDASSEMIKVAKHKFPNKELHVESATNTHFIDDSFDLVFSFHVFMHLDKHTIVKILDEAHRILKKGGRLVFDVPSKKRRQLTNFTSSGWHGSTDFGVDEIQALCQGKWQLIDHQGVLFFPIHRIPASIRKWMIKTDSFLCRSFLKSYSSYLIFTIEKT